jgi:hypothetical protein
MIYDFRILKVKTIKLPQQIHYLVMERSLNINFFNPPPPLPPNPTTLHLRASHVVHLYLTSHHALIENPPLLKLCFELMLNYKPNRKLHI